jgi:hypothetical protein
MYKPNLDHYVKSTLTAEQQAQTIAAFDAWQAGQPRDIQIVVEQHIKTLCGEIKNFGADSAKILLTEVYLLVGKYDRLETQRQYVKE